MSEYSMNPRALPSTGGKSHSSQGPSPSRQGSSQDLGHQGFWTDSGTRPDDQNSERSAAGQTIATASVVTYSGCCLQICQQVHCKGSTIPSWILTGQENDGLRFCGYCACPLMILAEVATELVASQTRGLRKRRAIELEKVLPSPTSHARPAKKLKHNSNSREAAEEELDQKEDGEIMDLTDPDDLELQGESSGEQTVLPYKSKEYCLHCHSSKCDELQCSNEARTDPEHDFRTWFDSKVPKIWHEWRQSSKLTDSRSVESESLASQEPPTLVEFLEHLYWFTDIFWQDFSSLTINRDALLRLIESDARLMYKIFGQDTDSMRVRDLWRQSYQWANAATLSFHNSVRTEVETLVCQVIKDSFEYRFPDAKKSEVLDKCLRSLNMTDMPLTSAHRTTINQCNVNIYTAFIWYQRTLVTIEQELLSNISNRQLSLVQRRVLRLTTSYLRILPSRDESSYMPRFHMPQVRSLNKYMDERFTFDQDDVPAQREHTDRRLKSIPVAPRLDYG